MQPTGGGGVTEEQGAEETRDELTILLELTILVEAGPNMQMLWGPQYAFCPG